MREFGRGLAALAVAAGLGAGALCLPVTPALAADSGGTQPMYRLYNPNSGEHFYTGNSHERDSLVRVGWRSEGTGWTAPTKSDTPVYRLYNPNAGDHHYTMSAYERDSLVKVGWNYEGIGWYSSDEEKVPLYRQYNPNARAGSHNYTTSKGENDHLVKLGWRAEGIGWYGVDASAKPAPAPELVAEGQFGEGCTWRLYDDGKLEISPTDGKSGTMAALPGVLDKEEVLRTTSIVIDRGVKAPADSSSLFALRDVDPFYFHVPLESIDASNLDVSGVTNMSGMFRGCEALSDLSPLASWDVSGVKDMSYMFYFCSSLSDATPLNSWTLSSSVNTGAMFDGCAEGIKTPSWYHEG